ncbi:glutaredoxin family protein [Streptomyces sp. Je 1-369]|uniref:glutaredoxin family protein n=1 Tax=Streptomyces sp. Je 1-369 TaxID=2966192 RepID=UPI00228582CE|nr:glutaredoxin family protein [Streptomyces sp. Je 1-369]WAL97099.1 glutaredoxin family protein [Streptomyces sp. Je 1-369]
MSPIFRRSSGRTSGRTEKKKPRERLVTLIGKPGCHLCDDAQSVIEKVCGELGTPWEKKDITRDEELHRAYWEQIPVVLVDGEQHTFWRVDEVRLRRELDG